MEQANESPVTLDSSGNLLLIVNQAEKQKTFRVSSFAFKEVVDQIVRESEFDKEGNLKGDLFKICHKIIKEHMPQCLLG